MCLTSSVTRCHTTDTLAHRFLGTMTPAQSSAHSRWPVVEGLRAVLAMMHLVLAAVDTHATRLPLDTGCHHAHQRAQVGKSARR